MYEYLFVIRQVFEADFIKSITAHRTICLDIAFRLVVRQRVGGHLVGVIENSGHQGAVDIAIEKANSNLLSHTRQEHTSPVLACCKLGAPDPTTRVLVSHSGTIPKELHFNATIAIGVDFFAFGPDHNG